MFHSGVIDDDYVSLTFSVIATLTLKPYVITSKYMTSMTSKHAIKYAMTSQIVYITS